MYSVDEDAGQVTVFVRLLGGELTSNVVIRLNTEDGSATSSGTYPLCCVLISGKLTR